MKGLSAKLCLFSGVSLLAAMPAHAQTAPAPAAAENDSATTSEIVVTARRREERLQDVPVAVSAFSASALNKGTVQTLSDLTTLTPGFTFTSEGGKDNHNVTLRGIGQIPLGEGTPAVVTYFHNVALPSVGSNVPTYDIGSIQILKGPQGTLFGKNTLGGAVLIEPQAPTFDFGGYVQGTYGRYDYRTIEGALNVPIISEVLAVRVAGQIRRQDPRIKALDSGPGFDNIHEDSFRVSVRFAPTDWIENTTIYDYYKADEYASGLYLLRRNFSYTSLFAGSLGPVVGGIFGAALDAQTDAYIAQQRANPRGSYDDGLNGGLANRKAQGITNDTSLQFGDITVRNIFGYRKNFSDQAINTGAVGALALPTSLLGAPANTPFTLFHAAQKLDRQYLSNEFQVLGDIGNLNFIVGGYYNDDKPNGPSGSSFVAFATPGGTTPNITAHVHNKNKAIFGQIAYKITDQLTFNAGARYSWDKVSACGGFFASGYVDDSTCRAAAAVNNTSDGIGVVANKGSAPSWTIGLDYKVSPDLMVYVVSRRGYRGANVNTPLFESRYTTGGTDPECGFGTGQCPDFRPFQKTDKETLTDVEIGEKLSTDIAGARFLLNTAAYYSKYKNALQFINSLPTGLPTQSAPDAPTAQSVGANVADFTIYGVELESSVSPTRNLTISFNGAYTHVKIDKVDVPALQGAIITKAQVNKFSPTVSGTASADWTLPFRPADGALAVHADVFMTADFGGQGGEKLPGYSLVNARIDWKNIASSGVDLGFYVRNVFDVKYTQSVSVLLSTFPVSSVYLGPPREWGVSGRFTF